MLNIVTILKTKTCITEIVNNGISNSISCYVSMVPLKGLINYEMEGLCIFLARKNVALSQMFCVPLKNVRSLVKLLNSPRNIAFAHKIYLKCLMFPSQTLHSLLKMSPC